MPVDRPRGRLIDLLAPVTDRDVLDLVTAQHEAFDEIVFISRRVATS
jgi:hypothetical protein